MTPLEKQWRSSSQSRIANLANPYEPSIPSNTIRSTGGQAAGAAVQQFEPRPWGNMPPWTGFVPPPPVPVQGHGQGGHIADGGLDHFANLFSFVYSTQHRTSECERAESNPGYGGPGFVSAPTPSEAMPRYTLQV